MADDLITTTVTSVSTEVEGRTLNRARHQHFVIDSPNGPGEALATGEAFLAGISACGVTLVQAAAKGEGIAIDRLEVDITGARLVSNPVDFHNIDVRFRYRGPSQADAERLTETWKAR
jgi:uncharacterized OsmC-like protein